MTAPNQTLLERGADILSTVVDATTRRVFAFLGDVKAKLADSDKAMWIQHVCWVSLPSLAQAGKAAAQAVIIRRSNGDVVIGSSDARTLEMYGQIGPGEFAAFAPGKDGTSQGRIIGKTDGSINIYTRAGNTSGGNGMAIMVRAADDTISITNGAGYGIIVDSTGIRLTAKDSGLTLGSDGSVKLIGKTKTQVDGASIVLGSVAVPGVNSAIHGPTGLAGVASLKTLIE